MQAVRSITRMLSGVRLAAAPASAPSYVIAAAHRRAAAAPANTCYLAQHVTPSNGTSSASAMSSVVLSALGASLGNRMVKEAPVKTMTSSGGRSISCTAARATGLNDFFVSFPDVDKDGKPMYPAVGAPAAVFMTRRSGLAFLSTLSMLCDFAVFLAITNSLTNMKNVCRTCVESIRIAAKVIRRPAQAVVDSAQRTQQPCC